MPPRSKEAIFRILTGVLALAEERGSVSLTEAAALAAVSRDELYKMLEPVLYLEFRTSSDVMGKTGAFLLDESDHLTVTDRHWLRDLGARPPDQDTALRLLVAGTVLKSVSAQPTPTLDRALRKLEQEVAADVVLAIDSPEHLPIVERAHALGRSVRCRYVTDAAQARDREIEPWFVFSNWGRWYVRGCDVGTDEPKWFRIDRMADVAIGDATFRAPEPFEVPEWFDLEGQERTVRLRMAAEAVDALPTPRRVDNLLRTLDHDRVECDVTVYGEPRLERLLVTIPPDAEVVDPAECETLRREAAAQILACYAD